MNDASHYSVVSAIAHHLAVDPLAIETGQNLEEDWQLDALDLVCIAADIEDELGVELPRGRIERARTVGALTAIVRDAVRSTKRRAWVCELPASLHVNHARTLLRELDAWSRAHRLVS